MLYYMYIYTRFPESSPPGHFQCVLRAAGVGTSNCLTGHRCVVAELDAVGRGHCEEGQIYASAAWELAPSSGGFKGCLEKTQTLRIHVSNIQRHVNVLSCHLRRQCW